MKYEGIIYKYTSPSGKCYIGQTIRERKRRNTFKNIKMHYAGGKIDKAREKYGPENFKYVVEERLEEDTLENLMSKLNEREIYYIQKYDSYYNGYNSTLGGEGGYGKICSEELKLKLSNKFSKKVVQYDLGGNFIKIWKSAKEVEETLNIKRDNIQSCCIGKNKQASGFIWKYLENISSIEDVVKGFSIEKQKKINNMCPSIYYKNGHVYKRILQYNILGNFIKEWDSIKDAATFYNAKPNSLSQCCNGDSKTCAGFIWKFYSENYPKQIEVNLTHTQILNAGRLSGMLRIHKYNQNMDLLNTYSSFKEAAEDNNIPHTEQITDCISGRRKTCKGFIWKYELCTENG